MVVTCQENLNAVQFKKYWVNLGKFILIKICELFGKTFRDILRKPFGVLRRILWKLIKL